MVAASDGGYAIAGGKPFYDGEAADFLVFKTNAYNVVPEATWVILPLLVTATVAIVISKKKLWCPRSQVSKH